MRKIKDLTADEIDAVVYALECLGDTPVRGVHHGPGRHVAMPLGITAADVRSGIVSSWIGWTHVGPDGQLVMHVPLHRCDEVEADNGEKIPDASKRAKAKNALKKGEVLNVVVVEATAGKKLK